MSNENKWYADLWIIKLLSPTLSDRGKVALFFKIIEFLFWFKTPRGRPPDKTEERKPDPWGN